VRLRQVQQDQPADDGVELVEQPDRVQVAAQERDVADPAPLDAFRREGQRRHRLVDADHRPGRADQLGRDERDVARAGAEVEHPHAGFDPGQSQQRARRWREHRRLVFQPGQFGRVVSE
jgi:hypothetical protein